MYDAILGHHVWLTTPKGEAVLVSLRTGRILATVQRRGIGWMSRIFIGPLQLPQLWRNLRNGHASFRQFKIGWNGLSISRTYFDRNALCQSVECWTAR